VVVSRDLIARGWRWRLEKCWSNAAAAPATIGVEKLVPEPVVKPLGSYKVADVLVVADEYTFSPTATRSGLMLKSIFGPTELKEEITLAVAGTDTSV
jgi:hypothetical protein